MILFSILPSFALLALSMTTIYINCLVLCAPIKSPKGEILGAIQAVNKVDELFGRADEELIQTLAAQVGEGLLLSNSVTTVKSSCTHIYSFSPITI